MNKFLNLKKKTLKDYKVKTHKELWDKVKGEYKGLVLDTNVSFTKAEGSENKYHCVFSTASVDRHGDVVLQNFDIKSFKKNPVFLDSHDYSSIEKILGKVINIKVVDDKLVGDIVFNTDSPLGLLARNMVDNGFLKATSIGFIPKDFNEKGYIIKSELLEISGVSVPANPEALMIEKSLEIKDSTIVLEAGNGNISDVIEKNEYIPSDKKKMLYKAISQIKAQDTDVLIRIAEGLNIKNQHERKRKLFSTIRQGLK